MKTLRLGPVRLRPHHPTVIAPFTDRTPLRVLERAAKEGLSLAEARVDLFRDRTPDAVRAHIEAVRAVLPVLVTVRAAREGGAWRDGEAARLALYRALLPVADAIDVELAAPIRADVVRAARRARRLVVLSHHDFERTPAAAALGRIVTQGTRARADIVKIAAHVADDADAARLAALFARHAESALVVVGMGEHGKKTRVFFPALGSLFTFASLDHATAPGQLAWPEMCRELSLFFPDYAPRPKRRRAKR
ncbi:MAG TPA: type I 3-dehydroquinate dehydratase [Polyangiaceae bacterium]|nr:type I 3-dehydroquinate dehydratase [Polyangiaceae bacterium]